MTILITGGAGFIGSHFARLKVKQQEKVVVLDKLTYAGNLENLDEITKDSNKLPYFKFHKGDICNKHLVEKIVKEEDVSVIVNFAADSHVDRSIMNADSFIDTDVKGTYTLLETAKENNVKRFIQISTDEVYGSIASGSFKESDVLYPRNPYSASKAGAEMLANAYWVTHKVPVIIARSCNNYGPNQYPEKLLPLFITNAMEDKELPVYGDGKQIRDWLHVEDNCSAIDFLLENGKPGETYNISAGNECTNIEITNLILNELKKPSSLIKHVKDRVGHDRRYSIDCSKIRSLGWEPNITFEDGIKSTIKWYITNKDWWNKIKTGEFLKYYGKQYEERETKLSSYCLGS
ncbi:MAG: dTDP-glucose 4,6-dehydratase [Candidatus Scalindua rubra]|uniref:dTDP-glucose 4,6-dehydratase n=1 Tax=Candidatus Scalindua rubra TaxID=1872076 RepID=A0A1E3X6D6_9BACT|nr:MAG: dTDP-glucose 4,6-dehydratase [Candidatus Scalindua rubra]